MKISIVGIGMFGFALALHLGKKYLQDRTTSIMAYDVNKKLIKHLKKHKKHLYHFKNKRLSKNISFTNDKKELVKDADIVILAVVSQAIRKVMREIKPYLKNGVVIVNTAKALEIKTAKTFYNVIKEEMKGAAIRYTVAKFSGGTFAEDLANGAPVGADIACENTYVLKMLQKIFSSPTLRVYGNTDVVGTEYAGAFKNIISILAGIVNGLKLPYGSETHMISRAAKEAKEIAVALGAKPSTFLMESQCWGNDLWMSCTGKSRNRKFGKLIGKGLSPKKALKKMQKKHRTVEGYYTIKAIPKLCRKLRSHTPIFQEIYKIVYKGKKPIISIQQLMNRKIEYRRLLWKHHLTFSEIK